MWAWRLTAPGRLDQVDVPAPTPDDLRPGEVLLRVLGGAVCGSDLPYFAGRVCPLFDDTDPLAARVPGFPLHEVVGQVLASSDPTLPVGARAVGWATRTDAMAEYVVTAGDSVLPVPEDLSLSEALTLQPLACVLGTVRRLSPVAGERVAVLGLGPFGLLFCHVLHHHGAASIVGVDRVDRTDVASQFCVGRAVHTSTDRWAAGVADHDRPTLVIEAVGHQAATITDALRAVAPGGRIFCFGVPDEAVYPVPFQEFFRKGATLFTGVVADRRGCLRLAVDYLRSHPELNRHLVTAVLPFHRAQEAFELASRPAPGRLKIQLVVEPDGSLPCRRRQVEDQRTDGAGTATFQEDGATMGEPTTAATRLADMWDAFREAGRQVVRAKGITEAELRAGATYLQDVAVEGGLVDLLELTFQTAAAENAALVRENPKANVEGPLYKAGAPDRADGVLYDRTPGPRSRRLTVSGRVTDQHSGAPVPGARLDFWQADENGDYDLDGYNLRGVLVTDEQGRYRLETIVPGSYPTHVEDRVSALYERMGRSSYRSAHIHFKVWIDGVEVLTSQFFDADSEYLDIDALAGAVRPELVVNRTVRPTTGEGPAAFEMHFDIPV